MNTLSDAYLRRFSEAVVQEIWTEMGRKRIRSVSALAAKMGNTPQYVTARLRHDPKTGKPVTIHVRDLAAFARALDVNPEDFVIRARNAVGEPADMFVDSDDETFTPRSVKGLDGK